MADVRDKIFGMSGAAREVMRCLFINGPTWDGNIPSKAGRGDLFDLGYADRVNGWSFLTKVGMDFAVNRMMLGEEKERRENESRARR